MPTRHPDSSVAEALQNSPVLEDTRSTDSALLFSFEDTLPSRSAAQNADLSAFPLQQSEEFAAFERQYLVEAMPPRLVERRSFDRSSIAQSTSGTNSPLAHIQHMQPSRPTTDNMAYTMPNASGSQEKLENDMRALMTSTSDTHPFPLPFPQEQGGSPSMDPNALQHSDNDTPSVLMQHDFPQQKSGYRREIEAKSRQKIRIAAQRLRNVISPLVKPGLTLRGTADVMDEAADQILQMGNRVLQMEREITSLRMQLQAKAQMRPAGQW